MNADRIYDASVALLQSVIDRYLDITDVHCFQCPKMKALAVEVLEESPEALRFNTSTRAWLVECGKTDHYFGGPGVFDCTERTAIRFARPVDADKFAREIGDRCRVVEFCFSPDGERAQRVGA